jgi:hypothetical protein
MSMSAREKKLGEDLKEILSNKNYDDCPKWKQTSAHCLNNEHMYLKKFLVESRKTIIDQKLKILYWEFFQGGDS